MATTYEFDAYQSAAQWIMRRVPEHLRPSIGIICGSGLGGLAEEISGEKVEIPYEEIPGFMKSTAQGHKGCLVFGTLSDRPVVCMQGRFHCYEGYSASQATFPIRVLKLIGVNTVIATNAAGCLNQNYKVGDVVILCDHVSIPGIAGQNGLIGHNIPEFGPRFPPVSDAYTPRLRILAAQTWLDNEYLINERRLVLHEGVYGWIFGPSYETRAECRALRSLGCDVVGMSTAPEVVVAKHAGMDVLALSLVTNMAVMSREPNAIEQAKLLREGKPIETKAEAFANHEEVLEISAMRAEDMQLLVKGIVAKI
ncbi:Purine nucleoside phosphorylase [Spiromyces aspiralis]|uniref:Purine nucleoside phosphorylase n=1 Tax=Spiromyces aspiralis TaxID=68401 RepID=A0ACC1HK10_9FUNG|nr:Purine nucleoside phosphorylase [Spiromyces aspiralis]